MFIRFIVRATALLTLALVPLAQAAAQEDDAKIVASVPTEIADIVTGGSWSADKQGGFYRAFVIMTGNQETFGARVFCNGSLYPRRTRSPRWLRPCRSRRSTIRSSQARRPRTTKSPSS